MNNRLIRKEITLNASLGSVWDKWTTKEGLLTFFGRDNQIEMEPGGPYEIYFLMDNPYGTRGSEGCKVLSFLPQNMLSFSWNAPPRYSRIRNHKHKTWVVINFTKKNDKTTSVELNHLGWLDGNEWGQVYDYFHEAWDTVIKNLKESFD